MCMILYKSYADSDQKLSPFSLIARKVWAGVCVRIRIFNHPHYGCDGNVPTSCADASCGIDTPAGDHLPPESPTHVSTLPDIDSDADVCVTQLPARADGIAVPAADHQPPVLSMYGPHLSNIDSDDDAVVAQLPVRKKRRSDEVRELSMETQRDPDDGWYGKTDRATGARASEYAPHDTPTQVVCAADARRTPSPTATHHTACGSNDTRWICTASARSSHSNAPALATVCDSVDDARQVRWACTVLRGGD